MERLDKILASTGRWSRREVTSVRGWTCVWTARACSVSAIRT